MPPQLLQLMPMGGCDDDEEASCTAAVVSDDNNSDNSSSSPNPRGADFRTRRRRPPDTEVRQPPVPIVSPTHSMIEGERHDTASPTEYGDRVLHAPPNSCWLVQSGHHDDAHRQPPRRPVLQLLFGATGIYAAYLCYGHVQEDIFSFKSPTTGESFHSVWLLQSLESVSNILLGYAGRHVFGGRKGLMLPPFLATGVSQLFAKALTSAALAAGLSFPICILCKSAKIVPVMMGQLLLGGSSYKPRDYLFATLVVAGTALLSMGSKKQDQSRSSTPLGLLFIFVSLCMDGITAGLQKRLLQQYNHHHHHNTSCGGHAGRPTPFDFMFFTSLAMGVVAVAISIATTDYVTGMQFLQNNPTVAQKVWIACICSAIGQSFIFYVVATFDPYVCSTITTTRKILSVVWSIIAKGHSLSTPGSLGMALALTGLLVEVQGKAAPTCRRNNTTTTTTTTTKHALHHTGSSSSGRKENETASMASEMTSLQTPLLAVV